MLSCSLEDSQPCEWKYFFLSILKRDKKYCKIGTIYLWLDESWYEYLSDAILLNDLKTYKAEDNAKMANESLFTTFSSS